MISLFQQDYDDWFISARLETSLRLGRMLLEKTKGMSKGIPFLCPLG
jgi:hypothetical protein